MSRYGQIWVETVIYTLIGLALIALVLAFVTPRINEARDRLAVEQTVDALNAFDEKVNAVLSAPGNIRQVDFAMKRGKLIIDGENDVIVFILDDLKNVYSEPGVSIDIGRVQVLSTEGQKEHTVTLTLSYVEIVDLKYVNGRDSLDEKGEFGKSSTTYNFAITNEGIGDTRGLFDVSIEETS